MTEHTDRGRAILRPRQMLETDFLVLDIETTGLESDDEAVQKGRIDQFEAERHELLDQLDQIESQRRAERQRHQQLKEAAWSVCAVTPQFEYDPQDQKAARSVREQQAALRRLANLIDFPGWLGL